MQIIDAMRASNSSTEICLLLTNYIESLQFYAAAEHLPACIIALPVCGLDDVEQRYGGLCHARQGVVAHSHGDIVSEAEEVLYEAMYCLRALDTAAGALTLPPAPTDVFRHA